MKRLSVLVLAAAAGGLLSRIGNFRLAHGLDVKLTP
jgi:hypothetical protein